MAAKGLEGRLVSNLLRPQSSEKGELRLEESLRRLPFQKRLDESMEQINLRDDGRV